MESSPLARYSPRQSKKRVFPGGSSSFADAEVVEISPPMSWSSKSKSKLKSKSLKQKKIIHHEVIDIDMDEESGDVMLIDEKVDAKKKGKEPLSNFSDIHSYSAKPGSMDGVQSSKKSSVPGLDNSSNLEGFGYDFPNGDDEYMDNDNLTYDDEYSFLQAHFDGIDIPPGVEAPIPWFSGPDQLKKNPATASSSTHSGFSIQLDASGKDSSHSRGLPELAQTGKKSVSVSSSSLKTRMDTQSLPQWIPVSSSLSPESSKNKKKALNSQLVRGFKSGCVPGFSHSKTKPAVSGSTSNYTSHNQLSTMKLSSGMESSFQKPYLLRNRHKKSINYGDLTYPKLSAVDTTNLPLGGDAYMSGWQGSPVFMDKPFVMSDGIHNSSDGIHFISENEVYVPVVQDPANCQKSATAAGSSTAPSGSTSLTEKHENDILKKFQLFKQFDVVQDYSDHHHASKGSSSKQPSKNWAKKIQDEWRILEKDLPDTIFVRVYESRMDLLRAVIVGAEGTPYHDGLFFFDVFFPVGYPNVPPHVYYHSGGLRINPNLYNCGKVCLSLLNTWGGSGNEKWVPGVSTMLQVLVSIQALILNEKPYFNEPGYAGTVGSPSGEKASHQYNENTFIYSLKTMVYSMKRPPKHFEDYVVGHFYKRAQGILVSCKAYMEGVQVGCLAKGGVQDVDAVNKKCSQNFKNTLASYIATLVQTFSQIGAEDCDKFLSLATKGNNQVVPPGPMATAPMATGPMAWGYY